MDLTDGVAILNNLTAITTMEVQKQEYNRAGSSLSNKNDDGWVPIVSRNTNGAETLANLVNLGTETLDSMFARSIFLPNLNMLTATKRQGKCLCVIALMALPVSKRQAATHLDMVLPPMAAATGLLPHL